MATVTLPPRIVHPKPRREGPLRCPLHLRFVRSHSCCAGHINSMCDGPVQAAHVRAGTDGGTGMKPGDNWTISLCDKHHRIQHNMGEAAFQEWCDIDMKALAQAFWEAFKRVNPQAARRAEEKLR